MKITDVKTVLLTGPSTLDPFLREARKLRSAAFVEIQTDAGLIGLGETYAGYFCPEMVPPIVDFFKPILLGQGMQRGKGTAEGLLGEGGVQADSAEGQQRMT